MWKTGGGLLCEMFGVPPSGGPARLKPELQTSINENKPRRLLRRLQSADYADLRRKKSAPSAKSVDVFAPLR
jgi:hypothetical protein